MASSFNFFFLSFYVNQIALFGTTLHKWTMKEKKNATKVEVNILYCLLSCRQFQYIYVKYVIRLYVETFSYNKRSMKKENFQHRNEMLRYIDLWHDMQVLLSCFFFVKPFRQT